MRLRALGGIVIILIFAIYIVAGIAEVHPGEVGILVKMMGKNPGMQKKNLAIGLHWVDPIRWDVYKYDIRCKQENELKDLPAQTKDGQKVSVDASLEVCLDATKVPILHVKAGRDYYNKVVYPAFRSILRNTTAFESSDAIYTGTGRDDIEKQVQSKLRARYEDWGLVITVNLRAIDFKNSDFVQVLEEKAKAAQRITIAKRNAEAAAQDAIKVANIAEGEKQKAIKAAEANREQLRLQGEGTRLKNENEAAGILAIAKAKAEGVRLQVQAYGGDGKTYASVRWAEEMGPNVKVLGYPLGAAGTMGLFNVNGILGKALQIK